MNHKKSFDRCRLFAIDRYGNLFTFARETPACIASYKPGRGSQEASGIIFLGTAEWKYVLESLPTGEYPTLERPSRLYSGCVEIGCVYADSSCGVKELSLKLYQTSSGGNGIQMEIPVRVYSVKCDSPQQNIHTPPDPDRVAQVAFRTLSYHISVCERGQLDDEFYAEQTLAVDNETRTLSIFGIEEKRDMDPILILMRLITLTGFPADAMPIKVVRSLQRE